MQIKSASCALVANPFGRVPRKGLSGIEKLKNKKIAEGCALWVVCPARHSLTFFLFFCIFNFFQRMQMRPEREITPQTDRQMGAGRGRKRIDRSITMVCLKRVFVSVSLLTCHTRSCCCCCCCWIIPCLGAAHGADQAGSGWDAICVAERCDWAHVWHSAKDLAKETHTRTRTQSATVAYRDGN